ncbi:hypothetical protein ABZ543_12715 [Streptomyces roseifaciens]
MTFFDWLTSLWRTVVPTIAGWVALWLAKIYVDIDVDHFEAFLATAFVAVYYGLFRYLEMHLDKRWGWLLGFARPPQYPNPPAPSPAPNTPTPPAPGPGKPKPLG